MADSKPRPDASASAASTDSDAKADPKSVTGVEEPASEPEQSAPAEPAADADEPRPEQSADNGDASSKPADKPEAAPADTGGAEPAPQVPAADAAADQPPAVDYKALAEAARAELDNLKAKLATQESLKAAGLAPELADYVTLDTPEDAQKLAAIIAPQPQASPFAPVGDDDDDDNITTIGNRIFGRR
jgi:hypothetical protein|nr:MAG TPA: hypothetical protein [Caudoviricetes sp.]